MSRKWKTMPTNAQKMRQGKADKAARHLPVGEGSPLPKARVSIRTNEREHQGAPLPSGGVTLCKALSKGYSPLAKIPTLAVGSQATAALRGETEPSRFVWQTARLFPTGRPQKKAPFGAFFCGLPERIRTFDLQSRSLTRYPAVPRVEICFAAHKRAPQRGYYTTVCAT